MKEDDVALSSRINTQTTIRKRVPHDTYWRRCICSHQLGSTQHERRPLSGIDLTFAKNQERPRTSRVAWSKVESVEEEMEEDVVAPSTVEVGLGSDTPSVGADEGSVDIVDHVSPYFANPCVKDLNLSNQQRELEE